MNNHLICPVCSSDMPKNICSNCGYTRFLFPKNLPQQVENFEETRVRIMKKCYKKSSTQDNLESRILSNDQSIIGTLMIRNLMTDSIYTYPIRKGKNIYGSLESDNTIRKFIDPLEIGVDIPDTIFGIEASETELLLIPNTNFPISHNRCSIKDYMKLEKDDYFFNSNILSFNARLF